MKFSYSLIKKLLPKAPSKPKLVEALNLRAFETENAAGDAFEVSLPPNRYSDVSSHLGIAREVSAIFGGKFSARGGSALGGKNPVKTIINPPTNKGFIKLDIKDQKLCPRYSARYFELKGAVGQSPKWMQEILRSCGIKSINNIVDVMNYVMLETGQPMHAFDADSIADSHGMNADQRGKGRRKSASSSPRYRSGEAGRRQSATIVVRRARKGEKIKTLDGQKFILDSDILVIADKEKPLAIAGIKGGEDSGVGPKTKRIIIEAANFSPAFIYRAARKLKLQTDASARFSHGMSPALTEWGLDRATELLLKTGAWLLDTVDFYPRPAGDEVIEFSPARYEAVIGSPVDAARAQKYFAALGFSLESLKKKLRDANAFLVRIPAWRNDIEEPEDLIEEVARLEGYGKFRPKAPLVSAFPAHQEDTVTLKEKTRRILTGLQMDEVYNSSFVGDAMISRGKKLGCDLKPAELENPIAEDRKYLRPALIPLLMKNAEDNSRFFDAIRVFEIGKTFSYGLRSSASSPRLRQGSGGQARQSAIAERLSLGMALAAKKDPKLVLEVKGLAEELMKGLGVDDAEIVPAGNFLRIEVENKVLGIIGHAALEKGWHAAFAELDLEKVMQFTEEAKEFIPLRRFPAVLRDVSVLVSKDVRIGEVIEEIQDANRKLIENVDLVDEYEDEKLGGKQSLTLRIIFQSDERTLTDAEVNAEMEKISAALKKEFRAEIR
ncbi:MAG: phenylalanine--tRNA ligase subunit beta [Patescibacteria group bacterium]